MCTIILAFTVDLGLLESPFLESRYSSNEFQIPNNDIFKHKEFLELSSNIYSHYSNIISEFKCQFYKQNRRITRTVVPIIVTDFIHKIANTAN